MVIGMPGTYARVPSLTAYPVVIQDALPKLPQPLRGRVERSIDRVAESDLALPVWASAAPQGAFVMHFMRDDGEAMWSAVVTDEGTVLFRAGKFTRITFN